LARCFGEAASKDEGQQPGTSVAGSNGARVITAVALRLELWSSKMPHQKFNACIEACNACAVACNHCAVSCLQEPDVKAMARCIALDIDCAEICALAAAAMSRASEHAKAICAVCADVCQACGDECAKHKAQHCQDCALACRECAQQCRKMAAIA
jgi:hypothetical protein